MASNLLKPALFAIQRSERVISRIVAVNGEFVQLRHANWLIVPSQEVVGR
jgi:hypothetical protein